LETCRSQLDDARDCADDIGHPGSAAAANSSGNELDALSEVNVTDYRLSADRAAIEQRPKTSLPLLPTDRADCAQQLELVNFGELLQSVPCSSSLIQQ
jgi:hypothetical protein